MHWHVAISSCNTKEIQAIPAAYQATSPASDGLTPMGIVFLTGMWKPTRKVFHVEYDRQKPIRDGFPVREARLFLTVVSCRLIPNGNHQD